MSVWYLRVSTSQIITLLTPIIIILLSTLILKETFHMRYFYGLILCLTGSFIIVINDSKGKEKENDERKYLIAYGTLIGITLGLISNVMTALVTIANKILAINKVSINTQMFYVALSTFFYTTIYFIYTKSFKVCIRYGCLCFLHGFCFYMGQFFMNKGMERVGLSKSITITYLKIVFAFLLGWLFLGESIFFTDILGALLIISYLLYNAYYPLPTSIKP